MKFLKIVLSLLLLYSLGSLAWGAWDSLYSLPPFVVSGKDVFCMGWIMFHFLLVVASGLIFSILWDHE